MVTLLQLINHVGNGFDVSRMEISVLKLTSFALDSKKIRRQRIRSILEEDQNQTQEELAESLGVSTSRFCTIESHGNDSKTRKLCVL